MSDKPEVIISEAGMLNSPRTRRDILRMMAVGGTAVFLPSILTACSSDDNNGGGMTGPGTGATVTIDFSKGDTAVLQFAYALEQLEADFYTRVVNAFGSSNLSAAEKVVLQDIKYHEVLHREFFKAALGSNGFTLATTYPSVNFNDRTSVLQTAKLLEDTGVTAYNGAAQYISDVNYLLAAGKIVSVEARHASAIADLISPNSGTFAPQTFDDVARPETVRAAAQGFVVQKIAFANAPAAFVQGPNNNA